MTKQNVDMEKIRERLQGAGGKIVLGIDGYIDSVWQILASRTGPEEYELYERMSNFSKTLSGCEEGGFSNEIIRKRRSYGGFTANTGKALTGLGVDLSMVGMFGKSSIDPVFEVFSGVGEFVSVGDPGLVTIYEFTDGKIMFVYTEEIMGFNWEAMTGTLDENRIKGIYSAADIIGLGYWSLMPAFDEIVTKICGLMKDNQKKQRIFFDFADIRKRDRESLESTLALLFSLNMQIPMTLSLNEHEAALLFSYYGETIAQEGEGAAAQTEKIRKTIGIDELVVHTPYFSTAASEYEGRCAAPQNYCTSPVITVGAGDHFNGGYMAAALKGLDIEERLTVGNAVTSLYISRGKSPSMQELLAELEINY